MTKEKRGGAVIRYIDILMDKWFKKVLGAESNKATLIALLRELIPERNIVDIFYNKLGKLKSNSYAEGHDAIFDVECIDSNGSRFVVEMQRDKQIHFPERALFYSTFPIQEQVKARKKGRRRDLHDKQYDYPPVYVISFLNFSLHKNTDQVLFRYDLRERTTSDLMTDRLNFIFLEMTNYRKPVPDKSDSFAEKLSYALTHMSILKRRPTALIEEVFGLLFAACDINLLTEDELQTYTRDVMTTEIDRQNIIYTARLDGIEEGLEKGREEEKRNTALNLKKLGVDIDIIVKATGLTKKEVESL